MPLYQNTQELLAGLRAQMNEVDPVTGRRDELGLAYLDALLRSGYTVELHPTNTEFIFWEKRINISNNAISAYEVHTSFRNALLGLFHHEYGHLLNDAEDRLLNQSAVQTNQYEYSINAFYKREGDAIARQFITDTHFGLDFAGVGSGVTIRQYYDKSVEYFRTHEISWSAFAANLSAEISTQLKNSGNNRTAAENYANSIADAVQKVTAPNPSIPGSVGGRVDESGFHFEFVNEPLYFDQLPDFDELTIQTFEDGSVLVEATRGGEEVFSYEYSRADQTSPPPYKGITDTPEWVPARLTDVASSLLVDGEQSFLPQNASPKIHADALIGAMAAFDTEGAALQVSMYSPERAHLAVAAH